MKLVKNQKNADNIQCTIEKTDLAKTSKFVFGITVFGMLLLSSLNKGEVHEIKPREYFSGTITEYNNDTLNLEECILDECEAALSELDSNDKFYVKDSVVMEVAKRQLLLNKDNLYNRNILNDGEVYESVDEQVSILAESISKNPKNYNLDNSIYTDGIAEYLGEYLITAYCGCASCCGKSNGITASGVMASPNRTLAAGGNFAFGTELMIDGQTYVVEDRGGAVHGKHLDMFFSSHSTALAVGTRKMDVYLEDNNKLNVSKNGKEKSLVYVNNKR